MKCEICNANEASIEVKQLADGDLREVHLCVECAAKHGLKSPGDLAAFFLGDGDGVPFEKDVEPSLSCPACHMRLSDFRKTSRLGCAQCYDAFAVFLRPMLDTMQLSVVHKGKKPVREDVKNEVKSMRTRLACAVKDEAYEKAAVLRDQIRVLEMAEACFIESPEQHEK